jgi:hypothetical protein
MKVKGGAIKSRLEFVRDRGGEPAVQRVLARLPEADRQTCAHVMTGMWYPFDLNERLDEAIAAEMGIGEQVFLLMGEKSATHNLGTPIAPSSSTAIRRACSAVPPRSTRCTTTPDAAPTRTWAKRKPSSLRGRARTIQSMTA